MTIPQGYLGRLPETEAGDRERVADTLSRMETIIEDVLAMAHSDSVGDPATPVDLAVVIDRACQTIDTAAGSIAIRVSTGASVTADQRRLMRLFENLFRNTVQQGGDDVAVRVGTTDDGLYVEDDGPGIPPDERDAVSEFGHTSDGTGLGLGIVKGIVDAYGWSFGVTESNAGSAKFEIDCPIHTEIEDGGRHR